MSFKKYQHVERLGTDETENILQGICHVFFKIDGTNASIWVDKDGNLHYGSRNRELSLENDNAGFMAWASEQKNIQAFFRSVPNWRLFGEWLVPHSLKTYRDNAWRDFYVFDVFNDETDEIVPFEEYEPLLREYEINYIPPLRIIKNPSVEDIFKCLDSCNQFLVKDGAGAGEGIVIKNYDYKNKYDRQTWAKVITAEFKEKHHKEMGAPVVNGSLVIEERILDKYLTTAFIEKEKAKLVLEAGGWSTSLLPKLFGVLFHELIKEEMWNILKEFKHPVINFRLLNGLMIRRVKEYLKI